MVEQCQESTLHEEILRGMDGSSFYFCVLSNTHLVLLYSRGDGLFVRHYHFLDGLDFFKVTLV